MPELTKAPAVKGAHRSRDPNSIQNVSQQLREALAVRWPLETVLTRIQMFCDEIGWSRARGKDVYYADPRVSLRVFEQDEINAWFDSQKESRA